MCGQICSLPSPPGLFRAVFLSDEVEAGHPQDVEEAVAHHVRYGVVHTEETLSEPCSGQRRTEVTQEVMQITSQEIVINHLALIIAQMASSKST